MKEAKGVLGGHEKEVSLFAETTQHIYYSACTKKCKQAWEGRR